MFFGQCHYLNDIALWGVLSCWKGRAKKMPGAVTVSVQLRLHVSHGGLTAPVFAGGVDSLRQFRRGKLQVLFPDASIRNCTGFFHSARRIFPQNLWVPELPVVQDLLFRLGKIENKPSPKLRFRLKGQKRANSTAFFCNECQVVPHRCCPQGVHPDVQKCAGRKAGGLKFNHREKDAVVIQIDPAAALSEYAQREQMFFTHLLNDLIVKFDSH